MFWFRKRKLYRAQGVYTVVEGNTGDDVWSVIAGVFQNDGARNWMPRHDPLKLVAGTAQQVGAMYEANTIYGNKERFYLKEFDRECWMLSYDIYLHIDGKYRDQPSESFTFDVRETPKCTRVGMLAIAFGSPRLPEARLVHFFQHFPIRGEGRLEG